jgi:membrane protease YdiL (CAAX protease family)
VNGVATLGAPVGAGMTTSPTTIDLAHPIRRWVGRHPFPVFITLAYTLSWAYWIPLALGDDTVRAGIGWPTQMPGLLGPAVAAVIVTALANGTAGLADLWARIARWRVGWWWLSVLVILLAGAISIVATDSLGETDDLTLYSGISAGIGAPATIIVALVVNGLGEEVGWRGFLADRLLRQHTLTVTALIVALVWAPWHMPLFFLMSSFQRFSPGEVVGWILGITAGSFVLAWLYRGSGASILLVAVWHLAFNLTAATEAGDGAVAAVTSTLVMVAVVVIIVNDRWLRRSGQRAP